MLSRLNRLFKFMFRQRVLGFSVPDLPQFDKEGSAYFMDRIVNSKSYLEYGCGGSTVVAANLKKHFVSVESDPFYLNAVRKKIKGDAVSGQLIYANIGLTSEWGRPLIKRQTSRRLKRWANYAAIPWTFIKLESMPDTILVDGRFRVLCALYSIRQLQGREFEILFDDYTDRSNYREVERFAALHAMHGRMAIFKPAVVDLRALSESIEKFSSDYR